MVSEEFSSSEQEVVDRKLSKCLTKKVPTAISLVLPNAIIPVAFSACFRVEINSPDFADMHCRIFFPRDIVAEWMLVWEGISPAWAG